MIGFTVFGRAQPAGSKRGFPVRRAGVPTGGVLIADDNPKAQSWKQEVRAAAADAMEQAGYALLDCPISLDVRFYLARPKAHFGSGRNAALVKLGAPPFPTVKPDTTKLVRAIEDALTGVVWRDDSLVITQLAAKLYGEPERVVVRVYPIEDEL